MVIGVLILRLVTVLIHLSLLANSVSFLYLLLFQAVLALIKAIRSMLVSLPLTQLELVVSLTKLEFLSKRNLPLLKQWLKVKTQLNRTSLFSGLRLIRPLRPEALLYFHTDLIGMMVQIKWFGLLWSGSTLLILVQVGRKEAQFLDKSTISGLQLKMLTVGLISLQWHPFLLQMYLQKWLLFR